MLPDGERQRRADHQASCIQEGIGFLADRADKAATLDGVNDTVEAVAYDADKQETEG